MDLITTSACIECASAATQIGDPQKLARRLVDYLRDNLTYQRGAIILKRRSDGRPLVFAHCPGAMTPAEYDREVDRLNRLIERKTNGVVHTVLESGLEIVVDDATRRRNYISADETIRSEVCFPLMVGNECIGVVNFESPIVNFFGSDDAVLMKMLSTQLSLHFSGVMKTRSLSFNGFR